MFFDFVIEPFEDAFRSTSTHAERSLGNLNSQTHLYNGF